MKILIGSVNPSKIEGAIEAFGQYYDNVEAEGFAVSSQVNEQPLNEEIYLGAKNRTLNLIKLAKENNIDADFYLSIESGITNALGNWIIVNVAYIVDKVGNESWGTSAGFPVPKQYVQEIIDTDLGKVLDKLFNQSQARKGEGGVSLLTKGKINRVMLCKDAFTMALTQYINRETWSNV